MALRNDVRADTRRIECKIARPKHPSAQCSTPESLPASAKRGVGGTFAVLAASDGCHRWFLAGHSADGGPELRRKGSHDNPSDEEESSNHEPVGSQLFPASHAMAIGCFSRSELKENAARESKSRHPPKCHATWNAQWVRSRIASLSSRRALICPSPSSMESTPEWRTGGLHRHGQAQEGISDGRRSIGSSRPAADLTVRTDAWASPCKRAA